MMIIILYKLVYNDIISCSHLSNVESGRPDVERTTYDFVFTPTSKSAFENFTIVNDEVLEFDELFIAEFDFGRKISNTWNTMKGDPSIAFILIRDDDCKLGK